MIVALARKLLVVLWQLVTTGEVPTTTLFAALAWLERHPRSETNHNPKPFTWTADPDAIIEKVRRGKQALESIH